MSPGWDLRDLSSWEFHGWKPQKCLTLLPAVKPLEGRGGWNRASDRDKDFLARFLMRVILLYRAGLTLLGQKLSRYFPILTETIRLR